MVVEIRALRGSGLHVGILILHRPGLHGLVHVPDRGNPSACRSEQHTLGRRWTLDLVIRTPQVFLYEFPLWHLYRFDQVGGKETILSHGCRGEGIFGDLAADNIQVSSPLGIVGEYLEETRIVNTMEIVVSAMHVETGLGDGPATQIEHIRQALARRGIQGLVHECHTLRG